MRLGTLIGSSSAELRPAAFLGDETVVDLLAAAERWGGKLSADGLRDHVRALERCEDGRWLSHDGVAFARALVSAHAALPDDSMDRLPLASVRIGPPITRPGKFIATGRNYGAHLRESQAIWAARGRKVEGATFPTAFIKLPSAIIATEECIVIPPNVEAVDYEIELVVVIGRAAHDVPLDTALDYVAGYTICNDVGARHIQKQEMEHQIGLVMSKNFPSFAPLGPWIVTADEIPDPQALALTLKVNNEVRQNASTEDMIFNVATLVSYWSRLGLAPGDMISTGTPSGVALAMPEPERYYLKPGDVVEASIERIGTLRNAVRG
jgi:2-keto-4-pentenoate hydratase/2-oxohepta-3-ene-1,7-dioic acid hydratase in catechol pathway